MKSRTKKCGNIQNNLNTQTRKITVNFSIDKTSIRTDLKSWHKKICENTQISWKAVFEDM